MTKLNEGLQPPSVLIFDWHGTLVDTHDAMFSAMEEMLPQLEELGLVEQLLSEDQCRTEDDARVVRHVRLFGRLPPRILAARRVARTDIFNAIFGDNKAAKLQAHKAYNNAYRKYFGQVKPFQPGAYEYLSALKAMGIKLAVSTNRNREFLDKELDMVDEGRWRNLFDATVCADDVTEYKPDPQVILKVLEQLGLPADQKAGTSATAMWICSPPTMRGCLACSTTALAGSRNVSTAGSPGGMHRPPFWTALKT